MTAKPKNEIQDFFNTGDRPTESQFIDFIDSYVDKLGPIGTIETIASGGTQGFAFVSARNGEVLGASPARNFMGITVFTTALAQAAVAGQFVTTAQASAEANAAIAARIATTAQAASADNTTNLMTPQLVNQIAAQPGLVLLGSHTASNASSVDIGSGLDLDAVIDGTYDVYILEIVSTTPTADSVNLFLRTSTDGGSSFAAASNSYGWSLVHMDEGISTVSGSNDGNDSEIQMNGDTIGNDTGESYNATVKIYDPANTSFNTLIRFEGVYVMATGNSSHFVGGGQRQAAESVNALRILCSSGNISGKFYLYGERKP